MKKIKSISILLFLAGWVLTSSISFMGCEPDDGDDDCDTCDLVRKPNIYLYPTETTFVQISLDFPMGGEVITSTPEYNAGWSVTVDPDGMIDNAFPYLFYESVQPDIWQKTSGWLVNKDDLGDFFKANLAIYGFSGREIDDFLEYWIPRLKDDLFYAIYPQTSNRIEEVIELQITPRPDNMLRLFFLIKGYNEIPGSKPVEPQKPVEFLREGYFVTEWGVILH